MSEWKVIPQWQIQQATGEDAERIQKVIDFIGKNKPTLIFHPDREIHNRIVIDLEQQLNSKKIPSPITVQETTTETKLKTPSPKKRDKIRGTLRVKLAALVMQYKDNKPKRDPNGRISLGDVKVYSGVIQEIVDILYRLTSLQGTTPKRIIPSDTREGSTPKVTYELTKINVTNWKEMVKQSELPDDLQGVLTRNPADFTSGKDILLPQVKVDKIPKVPVINTANIPDELQKKPNEFTIPEGAQLCCARCLKALDNDVGWTGGGGFDGLCCTSHRICHPCWWYHSNANTKTSEDISYIKDFTGEGAREFEDPTTQGREWSGNKNDGWSLSDSGWTKTNEKLPKRHCTFYCYYNNTLPSTAESTTETVEETIEETKSGKYRPVFRF